MACIAFIGDCHLGFRHRNKLQRLRDFAKAFEEAVEKAVALNPDVVVFLGDLVHHPKPDPVSLRTCLKRIMAVAKSRHVVMCIGNHEIEGHLGTTYSPLFGDVHPSIHVLTSENPSVKIGVGGRTYGFFGFEYTRARESAEEKLRKTARGADADVNILCLHQAFEKYLSPHEVSLSCLREVAPSFDLIVSGHVHRHQAIREVSDVTPAFYCGSTERISFNEAGNRNGFLVFTDDRWADPRFVEVNSATMAYVREEFKGIPDELNRRLEEIVKGSEAKLLKVDVIADLSGDYMDVRRDWTAYEAGRTVLDVSVVPKFAGEDIRLERVELSEDLIREYFQKTGNTSKELENLCVELYRRYGA